MASIPETWTQLKSSQTMPYKEFFEMLSCVVCHDNKCKEVDLLPCCHVVCVQKCKKSLDVQEDNYFDELQFGCTKCMIKSSRFATLEMRDYVVELMWLRTELDVEWDEVWGLRMLCTHCETQHWKGSAEEFRDIVEVCTHCRPPQMFCRMTCATEHAQLNEGHKLNAFDPDHHEWHARYLYWWDCVVKKYGNSSNVAAGATDAIDEECGHLAVKLQLLDDIDATLALFLQEETIRRETLRELEKLQLPIDRELPRLLRTIALEKEIYDVLVRFARHQTILKALVHLRPQKLSLFRWIQKRLSLSRLQKLLFSVSYINIDSSSWTYVVPAYQLVHHSFQKNLIELVSNKAIIPISDGPWNGGVEIGLLEQKQSGGWSEISRKNFIYANIACPGIMVPDALKILEIAEDLYIVSRPRAITLIRVNQADEWIREQFFPVQSGFAFGRGLCWNGRSLFATVVGTNYICRWTFQKNSFVVDMRKIPAIRIASKETNSNLEPFKTDDTIAEVNEKLYICYDRSDPDRKLSLDPGSMVVCELISIDSFFVLKSTNEFKQVSLAQPRLLGVWGELLNIVLLDAQAQTPTVYFLAGDGSAQESSFKMEFNFMEPFALKDIWMQRDGDLCLSVESDSGRVQTVKIKLH